MSSETKFTPGDRRPFRPCGVVHIAIGYSAEWSTKKSVPFEGVGEFVVTPDTEYPGYRVVHCASGYGILGRLSLQRARLLAATMEIRFPRFTDAVTAKAYAKLGRSILDEFKGRGEEPAGGAE